VTIENVELPPALPFVAAVETANPPDPILTALDAVKMASLIVNG
jgi:hypothetical protein